MDADRFRRFCRHLHRERNRLVALERGLAAALDGVETLTYEIGCGHGHYLAAYAAAHPEEVCLGVDLRVRRVRLSTRKQSLAALPNLLFVRAEGEETLKLMPPHVRLGRVLVLFPDPWPKPRHHKNRLLQPAFLDLLAARMAPGGTLCFRTDHEPYFAWAVAHLSAHPRWALDPAEPWPFEEETWFQQLFGRYQSLVARPLTARIRKTDRPQ